MPKPPAFQFYARDWLSSTLGMPRELKAIYIDLLAWSWDNGPVPDNPQWRANFIGANAIRIWRGLKNRWEKTELGWINPRLELQRALQNSYSKRGALGAESRWKNGPQSKSSMAQPYGKRHAKPMANRWPSSASASASLDQDQPVATRPVSTSFKTYAAIAKQAIRTQSDPDLAREAFKVACARQGLPYDATITTKAMAAAEKGRQR